MFFRLSTAGYLSEIDSNAWVAAETTWGASRMIAKRFAFLLTLIKTPSHHVLQRVEFLRIVVLSVEQKPRVGDNRVRILAIGIGHEQSEVGRHLGLKQGFQSARTTSA